MTNWFFFIPAASATFASDSPESFPLFGNWSDSYFVAVVVTDWNDWKLNSN